MADIKINELNDYRAENLTDLKSDDLELSDALLKAVIGGRWVTGSGGCQIWVY